MTGTGGDVLAKTRRFSRPRELVRATLDDSDVFLTAQGVHDRLRASGERVGLSTVYRNLQLLADDGEVDVLRSEGGEALYRACGDRHHHHLICRRCGLAVEVSGPGVERWAARIAEENGFVDVTHSIELFGLCASCAAASA
ncbi:MAG: transcriptional repressor [Candidatus Nanopelagicales bacterium]|jgi:Fur family ferric uptake transcriptional regulator